MAARRSEGDALLAVLSALASPHRLRILAALIEGRTFVSQLARDLEMNRPLLHMHLQKLQAAGLVDSSLELSDDGKALRYYTVTDFAWSLDASTIARAAQTLTDPAPGAGHRKGQGT